MGNSLTLKELAALVDGELTGNGDLMICGLNGVDLAEPGQITYIARGKMLPMLVESKASAAIVPKDVTGLEIPCIRVANPEWASAVIHQALLAKPFSATGISSKAAIGADCRIDAEVSIAHFVSVGDRVTIGTRVTLAPGVVIGDDCTIDDDCILHANVTVAAGTRIGKRVIIHSGTAIGSDGFGYATDAQGIHVKRPQVGTVRIDDDVEIGANTCVDRAAFGVTWIQRGVKIDNLVQIAHNVVIGAGSIIVAGVGISGSTTLGGHVVVGGAAGIAGHLTLEDGVMVAAMSGVHNSQPKGAVIGGSPAFDARKWAKCSAAYTRLPDMVKEIRQLRKELDRLAAAAQGNNEATREDEEQ